MTSVAGQLKHKSSAQCDGCPALVDQQDTYILKGGSSEKWVQRFVWHGMRYAEVVWTDGVVLHSLTGLPLYTDLPFVSEFSSSSTLLNDVDTMLQNTQLSNMMSVQSDCPHREKLGYGGDAIASAELSIFFFDKYLGQSVWRMGEWG